MQARGVKSAAIYVRQSKDLSEGVDRQLVRARKLVKARGWTVLAEYEDNATSASKARKADSAWSRMLRSDADVIVAVDMDRLLRSVSDLLPLIESGKKVVTVDGEIDLTTADGEFRATMLAAIARFEVRRKSERQKRANEHRRGMDAGAMPVPGKRRFGFNKGNITEHPTEGPLVRWAFGEVLNGVSVYSIAKELGRGIDFTRGMLRNPAYAGYLTKGTYTNGRRVSMQRFEADARVARLVDRDTFEKVQTVLDAKPKNSPGNKVSHLLSGLIVCDVCGARAVYRGGYRCVAGHVTMREDQADPVAVEELLYVLREPEESEVADSPEVAALVVEEAELERQRTAAQQIALMPGANLQHLSKELARIGAELERVQTERRTLRRKTAKAELSAAVMEAWNFDGWEQDALDQWRAYFGALPFDQQRELIRDNLSIRLERGRTVERLKVDAL